MQHSALSHLKCAEEVYTQLQNKPFNYKSKREGGKCVNIYQHY